MRYFSATTLVYVVHHISIAEEMLRLAVSGGVDDPKASPGLQQEITHAIEVAEEFFREKSMGHCAQNVSTAKTFLQNPTITSSSAQVVLQRLKIDILQDLGEETFLRIVPRDKSVDYERPLIRWGAAATKFPTESMQAASRCFALDEWGACVYHSMCVLEDGLRWLASQFQLTLSKPVQLENWNSIIENVESAIERARSARGTKKTLKGDEDLNFYSRAAKEFQYFRVGWRNHVMHDRAQAYDVATAQSTLEHVVAFMAVLAERA